MAQNRLIAGCGALGNAVARRLAEAGRGGNIFGLRRNIRQLDDALRPLAADLSNPASLSDLPAVADVIYTATPATRDVHSYHAAYVQGLRHLMDALPRPPRRLIYVSSTSVFGENSGQWVAEDTPLNPATATAAELCRGEAVAAEYGAVIIRFAGIYGEHRRWLIRQAMQADCACPLDPPQWTNRIHEYDCVSALIHLLDMPLATAGGATVFHGVDDEPAPRYEVLSWLREQLGLPPPAPVANDGGQGKRVANQRLRQSGWQVEFSDYRAGYRALLESMK